MEQFINMVCEMAPYLLLGFLLAGLMHAFIPSRFYRRFFSANRFQSVVNAALFGIPLPLCSCGVIPTAMSLRKEGASRGAVVSFLIATPQTGIDSIIATYGLMGLPFAILRPIAALCTALVGGSAAMLGDKDEQPQAAQSEQQSAAKQGFFQRLKEALRYGYVEMIQDIGPRLVVGLAVAAVITICVPTEWFTVFEGNTWASMLLVLAIAIPMYICATGSIPIAVALMLKGLTPGAALVLLMAGPACNIALILVVRKVLGNKTMLIYLASIIAGAVVFGTVVDYLQFSGTVDFLARLTAQDACCIEHISWFSALSAVALLLLLFNALVIQRIHKNKTNTTNMKTYHIEGMHCNHCRMFVEKAILSVDGVSDAKVDLQKKEAYVEGTATEEAVRQAVEKAGYTCTY